MKLTLWKQFLHEKCTDIKNNQLFIVQKQLKERENWRRGWGGYKNVYAYCQSFMEVMKTDLLSLIINCITG